MGVGLLTPPPICFKRFVFIWFKVWNRGTPGHLQSCSVAEEAQASADCYRVEEPLVGLQDFC